MSPMIDRSRTIERMKNALKLDPAQIAALTIDCQRGNLDPAIASLPVPESECDRVIAGTNRLLALARRAGIPVIHATTVYEAPLLANHPFERAMLELKESFTPDRQSNFAHHKSPGSVGGQIVPALDVQPADLIVDSKRTFDSFLGTPLELLLRFMKIDTLLIAGCNTNTCVLATAFGAYNRGLRVVVVSDCVASAYGHDLHQFALANIERRLGWVLTLGELEEKLASRESTLTPA
ncbi:MAG: cysteine hydrolase family protein [Betaproteobacteria bacterium]